MSRTLRTEPEFVLLFHHRWAVPLLAALVEREGGAKRITLQKTMGVGRDSLNRTLTFLSQLGLVKENPGYGHPMRPEILLTAAGRRVGQPCAALVAEVRRLRLGAVAFRKWTLPVVHVLGPGGARFSQAKTSLPGITPRALTSALRDSQESKLIRRSVADGAPPAVNYLRTARGEKLGPVLGRVAVQAGRIRSVERL